METLELDLIDKTRNGYIVRYCTRNLDKYGSIVIPNKIYNWYINAIPFETNTYIAKRKNKEGETKITITKNPESNYNKFNKTGYRMKIEFNDNVIYVSDNKFNNTIKYYSFQILIDIKVLDGNGQLLYHKYKLLKNYDTRSKAVYYAGKYAYNFARIYKKYFIDDKVTYNVLSKKLEVFHEDIIYEHEYLFRTTDGNGISIYTFTILSIEKG